MVKAFSVYGYENLADPPTGPDGIRAHARLHEGGHESRRLPAESPDVEHDDVGLDGRGVHRPGSRLGTCRGEARRPGVVVGKALEVVIQVTATETALLSTTVPIP